MRESCGRVSSWRTWWMSSASMLKASGRSSAWHSRPRPTSTFSSSIVSSWRWNPLHQSGIFSARWALLNS